MYAIEKYQLDKVDIGMSVLVRCEYSREAHVRVSNRVHNYMKYMDRNGVPVSFTTRRAVTAEEGGTDEGQGVVIERIEYRKPQQHHRPKRKKKAPQVA